MSSPTPNQRPDRVLVVDDDARIRDLLRRYLSQEGFEVLLAEDAKYREYHAWMAQHGPITRHLRRLLAAITPRPPAVQPAE